MRKLCSFLLSLLLCLALTPALHAGQAIVVITGGTGGTPPAPMQYDFTNDPVCTPTVTTNCVSQFIFKSANSSVLAIVNAADVAAAQASGAGYLFGIVLALPGYGTYAVEIDACGVAGDGTGATVCTQGFGKVTFGPAAPGVVNRTAGLKVAY